MAANPALPVSRLINVTVNLSPAPPQGENIDTMLILGDSPVIDTVQRMREYSSLTEVLTDFGGSAPEALAATLWFEQNPQPVALNIGRWAREGAVAELVGGPLTGANQAISLWNAVTSGGFFFRLSSSFGVGLPVAITGLNFSASANLNAVAAAIQTALQAQYAQMTCVWNPTYSNFTITGRIEDLPADSVSFLSVPTGVGNITFTGNPSNLDTVTVNGTSVEFVSGAPSGNEVQIGGTDLITAQSLYTFLSGSSDVNIAKMSYAISGLIVYCFSKVTGSAGDAYTLAKSAANITLSGATLTGGNAVDISAMLEMQSTPQGAYTVPGVAAETLPQCMTVFDNLFANQWYGCTCATNTPMLDSEWVAGAGYVEGSNVRHYFGVTSQEPTILEAGDTSNVAYQLQQLGYNHTCVQYSSTNPYAVTSYLARILTTNWAANNTTITLMYKQEPGIVAETLTTTQIDALESFNANVFVNYNNKTAIIENGKSSSGQYTDTIIGLDWLSLTMQNDLYTALYESTTKIPQTDAGNSILAGVIAGDCNEAVNNGLVAPGVWDAGGFGALKEGDFLKSGYYIYQPPVAQQSLAARAARQSVAFQIAVKLAGAIQTVSAQINVSI